MRFNFWEDFLSLLFPRTCCVCRRSLFVFEEQLCKICIAKLPVTSYHLIPFDNDLKIKLMGLAPTHRVMAFLRFSKKGMSQKILHQIKYKNKPELGNVIGKLYGQLLLDHGLESCWDIIVPVPLHQSKLRKRGYNQSERFADGLAEILKTNKTNALVRSIPTKTQTNKSRLERWQNVSHVFHIQEEINMEGKRILLVDDVMTTGATLSSCVHVLNRYRTKSIDIAVIAAGL